MEAAGVERIDLAVVGARRCEDSPRCGPAREHSRTVAATHCATAWHSPRRRAGRDGRRPGRANHRSYGCARAVEPLREARAGLRRGRGPICREQDDGDGGRGS